MRRLFIVLLISLSLMVAGQNVFAVDAAFNVGATVSGVCTNISATSVDLNYVSGGQEANGFTTISVVCTTGTSVNVSIDAGSCSGSTVQSRTLCSGNGFMDVNLNANGDSNNFTTYNIQSTTGGGTPDEFTVDVIIPAGQDVPSGDYSSTFTVSTDL